MILAAGGTYVARIKENALTLVIDFLPLLSTFLRSFEITGLCSFLFYWCKGDFRVVIGGLKGTAQLYSAQILKAKFLKRRHFFRIRNIIRKCSVDKMLFYLSLLYGKRKKNIPAWITSKGTIGFILICFSI